MSAQARKKRSGGGGPKPPLPPAKPKGPVMQANHRKGRSPLVLYAVGLAAVLLIGAALLWGGRLIGGITGPGPRQQPVSTTTSPPAPSRTATGSTAGTVAALPPITAAESAAAVKAAALPYPNPPAVTPQTLRSANPSRNIVALTFEGAAPDTRTFDLLESRNVKLTTFLTGRGVKARPDLAERLAEAGFEVANRTWDAKDLTTLADAEVRTEIRDCQARISAITKDQAPYLRPPGGKSDARVQRIAGSMGFRVVLWSRSAGDDAPGATADGIYRAVMDGLMPGEIVRMHWGTPDTAEALQRILPEMERRGLTPVTVSELLKYSSTAAGAGARAQGAGGAGTRAPSAAEGGAGGAGGAKGAAATGTAAAARRARAAGAAK